MGIPVSVSWRVADLKCTTLVYGLWERGLPAEPRERTPRQARRTPGPARPGPQADGITSTRPPDLLAQTGAALACCYRRPLRSRLPAAPSPSPHSKTPPCSPQAGSRDCAAEHWGAEAGSGGGSKGHGGGGERGQSTAPSMLLEMNCGRRRRRLGQREFLSLT